MAGTLEQEAIRRLVDIARFRGTPDEEAGRRRWTRYRLGTPLEVAIDPSQLQEAWHVITHHVSGGGIGFWSRQDLMPGQRLFVREYKADAPTTWLGAEVRYSVVGIRGYLVGIAFEHPADPDLDPDEKKDSQPVSPAMASRQDEQKLPPLSLVGLSARASALGSAVALAGVIGFGFLTGTPPISAAWVASCLIVPIIGIIAGARVLAAETRPLGEITRSLHMAASGRSPGQSAPKTRTRELTALGQATSRVGQFQSLVRPATPPVQQASASPRTRTGPEQDQALDNMLVSIQAHAETLERHFEDLVTSDQHHALTIISEKLARLSRMMGDMLEIRCLEGEGSDDAGRTLEPADIVAHVARVHRSIAETQSVTLAVECPAELPAVRGTMDRLARAIGNVVDHAMGSAGQGGIVRLRAERRDGEVRLRIGDTGPAIPRDQWDSLFEVGVSQPDQAHGDRLRRLGLYVARRIIEGYDGRIWIESVGAQSTEFVVAFPLAETRPGQQAATHGDQGAGRVLICDADAELVATIANGMRKAGFEAETAHSGARLAERLAQQAPDVLVTDSVLPDMPTSELFTLLGRNSERQIKTVLHSADGDYRELCTRGVDLVMRRPVRTSDLVQAVRIVMMKKAQAGFVAAVLGQRPAEVDQLAEAINSHGHVVLRAANPTAGVVILSQYPIDLLILASASPSWLTEALRTVEGQRAEHTRLVVLRPDLDLKQCEALDSPDVFTLPYRPGMENAVASAMADLWKEMLQSPTPGSDPHLSRAFHMAYSEHTAAGRRSR